MALPRILTAALLATAALAQGPLREAEVRAHLAFLADEALEGRGTGQRGGELAVRYLEAQLQALGFQPLGGSYRQRVPLAGLRLDAAASALAFEGPGGTLAPALGPDLVAGAAAPEADLPVDAPLVFVGHGAEGGGRQDFQGVDVRGRVLVMLVGDRHDGTPLPLCCEAENYQGRWTHKFEEARRRGAAGALLIHTTPSAGYGWAVVRNGWTQERFQRQGAGQAGAWQGWLSEAAARRLFALAGQDLAALVAAADTPAFRPVALPLRVKGRLRTSVRTLEQFNVVGVLPGRDPRRREEAVVLSAHWDHFGKGADGAIYPGAVDNGTGCAGALALARALAADPPDRSVVAFFPCAEEHGLLGSSAYVAAPLWPLARTRLVVNLESLNVVGPTRDIGVLGTPDPALRALCAQAAAAAGLALAPLKADPAGLCFRTDHFPFMKAGVPAVSPGFSLDGGWDYLGDRAAAQARAAAFMDRYHRPTDRYDPAWNLEGMMQQLRFSLELVRRAASAP